MWIRKTQTEIDQEQQNTRRNKFWGSFLFIAFILIVSLLLGGWGRFYRWHEPKTWQQIFQYLPFLLMFSFLFAMAFASGKGKRTYVCLKCGQPKMSMDDFCKCGGNFIDLREVKWVEDSSEQEEEPIQCANCDTVISKGQKKCPKCGWSWIQEHEDIPDIEKRFFKDN